MRTPLILSTVLLASVASADTLLVPSQHGTILEAVVAAADGDTILVAPGIYSGPGNRDIDLGIKNLEIRSELGASATYIRANGTFSNPRRGFLIEGGQDASTIIEGFTIIGGATEQGAILDQFNGGGIRINDASPIIRGCVFEDCLAGCWGGALFCGGVGEPLIENCIFRNNVSHDGGGAMFSWENAGPTVRGCLFIGNDGTTSGGAILHFTNNQERLVIENCTFWNNTAPNSAALSVWGADVINSIIWGNHGSTEQMVGYVNNTVQNSCIEGGLYHSEWDMGGNIDTDPLLRGWRMTGSSPCLDAGKKIRSTATDLDGDPRKVGRIDMGCDEYLPHRAGMPQ